MSQPVRAAAGPGAGNVVSLLEEAARRAPSRPALVMEGRGRGRGSITFAALVERVDRIAAGLGREGLDPGERAIVMVPMSIDLYAALLGVLKLGAVAVFVDPWIGARQIAAFSAFASPRAFIGVPQSHLLRLLDARLRRIALTVTTGRRLLSLPARRALRELERAPGAGRLHSVGPGDPALITFTTGSSGTPKGANRTHGFLLAQHRALAAEFPALEGDVDMPMFPVFALNNLALGVTSVVPAMDFRRVGEVDAEGILDQIRRHRVTTATASPPFFDRLAARLEARGETLALRRLLTGGAPVADGELCRWRAAFPGTEITVVYGSTEAEPVAHITAEERLAARSDVRPRCPGYCAGRPSGRLQARVIRIHRGPVAIGEGGWPAWEVPRGEIGELLVAGEHVARDYYQNPEAVRQNKVVDGSATVWHRMGDTGYFDGEGRFWISGRVHTTIRRAGGEVHPQLLEQAAQGSDPRVLRAAAVGVPDPGMGERVVVVIEAASAGGVARDAEARIREAGLPVDEVRIAAEPLPLDPRHNSKVDYGKLRARLEVGARPRPRGV